MAGANVFPEGFSPLDDPTKQATIFNHFMKPTDYDTDDWEVTTTGSGTIAISDAVNGELLLTNSAANNDALFVQSKVETLKFTVGKQFFFKVRLKVSDATKSDWIMGFAKTDTTPLDASDGVFFKKDDGDTDIDVRAVKNGTATNETAIGTNADDTYVKLSFFYDGLSLANGGSIRCWVDEKEVGGLVIDNLPDDEELAFTFGIQNGEAVGKTMAFDYYYASMIV